MISIQMKNSNEWNVNKTPGKSLVDNTNDTQIKQVTQTKKPRNIILGGLK